MNVKQDGKAYVGITWPGRELRRGFVHTAMNFRLAQDERDFLTG